MHTVNLGPLHSFNGSVIVLLCEQGHYGDKVLGLEVLVERCSDKFRAWRKSNKVDCSQPRFTFKSLGIADKIDFPNLQTKAYNTRVIVRFLADETLELARRTEDGIDCLVAKSAFSIASFFDLSERSPRYLTEKQAEGICEQGNTFIKTYVSLAHYFAKRGRLLFQFRPKLHGLRHMCINMKSELYNFRFQHTFRDEHCMGLSKRMAKFCHRLTLEESLLRRVLLFLAVRNGTFLSRAVRKHRMSKRIVMKGRLNRK